MCGTKATLDDKLEDKEDELACPICLESFEGDDRNQKVPRVFPCGARHTFCTKCVTELLEKQKSCALCDEMPSIEWKNGTLPLANLARREFVECFQKRNMEGQGVRRDVTRKRWSKLTKFAKLKSVGYLFLFLLILTLLMFLVFSTLRTLQEVNSMQQHLAHRDKKISELESSLVRALRPKNAPETVQQTWWSKVSSYVPLVVTGVQIGLQVYLGQPVAAAPVVIPDKCAILFSSWPQVSQYCRCFFF